MSSIRTKTGDPHDGKSLTSLYGGERIHKIDKRVRVTGKIDTFSSTIGLCRTLMHGDSKEHKVANNLVLREIQLDLQKVMAEIMTPTENLLILTKSGRVITEEDVKKMEDFLESYEKKISKQRDWLLYGESPHIVCAQLYFACAYGREAEIELLTLDFVRDETKKYMNVVTKSLFVLARFFEL